MDEKAPIRIHRYLLAYRDSCNTNGIHEGVAMWNLKYTVSGMVRQNLAWRMSRPGTGATQGRLTTYAQVVNWLLTSYDSDGNVSRANQEVRLMIHDTMDLVEYANTLNDNALFCGNVYPESNVMSIFLDGANPLIVENVRQY